jgi:sialic acid synthase SpsE
LTGTAGATIVRFAIVRFASCWEEASGDFLGPFGPPWDKIASASLWDDKLLRHHRRCGRRPIVSTGMSSLKRIEHAVDVLGAAGCGKAGP